MRKNVLRNEKDLFDSSILWNSIVKDARPLHIGEDMLFYSAGIDREYSVEDLFNYYSIYLNGNREVIETPSDLQSHLESSAETSSGYFTPGSHEGIWRLHLPSVIYDARKRIDVLENLLQDVTTYIEKEEVFNLESFIKSCEEPYRDKYCQEMILIFQELFQLFQGNSMHLSFISNGSERLVGLDKFRLDTYLRKFYKLISKDDELSAGFCMKMLREVIDISNIKRPKLEINRYDATDHFTLTLDPIDCKVPEDAISYKEYDRIVRIGMHIIDLNQKVLPNNLLDRDARELMEDQHDEEVKLMLPFWLRRWGSLVSNKKKTVISLFFDFDKNTKRIKDYFLTQSDITIDEGHKVELGNKQVEIKELKGVKVILTYLRKTEELHDFMKFDTNSQSYQAVINVRGVVSYLVNVFNGLCRRTLTQRDIPFLKDITRNRKLKYPGKGHFTAPCRRYEALFNIRQLTSCLFNRFPEYDPSSKSIEELMEEIERALLEDHEKT